MIDPWRVVDADDAIVADLLAATVEVVLECGGWLHPELRIVGRDGQLRMEGPVEEDAPILFLPAACYVRVGRVGWTDSTERLEFLDVPAEFDGVEREQLILQTALLNQCGKVPALVASHPALTPDLAEPVIDAVRRVRPDFRTRPTTAAGVLWSTRCLRLPAHGSDEPEPAALPLVDLLNHHAGGATGLAAPDGFSVTARHPTGTAECFLDYGTERGPLDLAVDYGFVDASSVGRGSSAGVDGALLDGIVTAASQHPSLAARMLAEAASAHPRGGLG